MVKLVLIGVVVVWGGSLCALVVGAIVMRRRDVRAGESMRSPATRRSTERRARDAAGHLTPDPGLLVPWSAIRGSKARFGVCEGTLRPTAEDDALAAAPPKTAA